MNPKFIKIISMSNINKISELKFKNLLLINNNAN